MARRSNLLPIVTSNDVTPALGLVSDVDGDKDGSASPRCETPKLKGDCSAFITLSDTEEPGVLENESKYKKFSEVGCKAGQDFQMVCTAALPPEKNNMISGKDLGDGVFQQGSTSQGSAATRSSMPSVVQKVRAAKQFRTSNRLADRAESEVGPPPTRKLYDHNACLRDQNPAVGVAANFLVLDVDDGREEILAAKTAANTCNFLAAPFPFGQPDANSSLFWRQMETVFGSISEADLNFLKQQVQFGMYTPDEFGPIAEQTEKKFSSELEAEITDHQLDKFVLEARCRNSISLWQRVTAALITDEDEDYFCPGTEETPTKTNGSGLGVGGELEYCSLRDSFMEKSHATANTSLNEYHGSDDWRSINSRQGGNTADNPVVDGPAATVKIDDMPSVELDDEYVNMSIDEKLLLELQSIGIFPDQSETQQADYDEISLEMRILEEKYHVQVLRKEFLIGELLKATSKFNELQQKNWEESALDKLVTMAYGKYMAQGLQSFDGENPSSKKSREATLEYVRKALEYCQNYEATGSCFDKPSLSDTFHVEAQSVACEYPGLNQCMLNVRESPLNANFEQNLDEHDSCSRYPLLPVNLASELMDKDMCSYEVKKRKFLLDSIGTDKLGGVYTRGKRKCDSQIFSRAKVGRPALSIVEGEEESKTKPKQTTLVSALISNRHEEMSSRVKASMSSPSERSGSFRADECKEVNDSDATESKRELSEMEVDISSQAKAIGSWLNVADDGLADVDDRGLQIPVDDLSDVKLMV